MNVKTHFSYKAQVMADGIKIATVNCQGLATLSKRQDVLNFYKTKQYSILCLQDTHFVLDTEPYVEAQWGYTSVFLIPLLQIQEEYAYFLIIILNLRFSEKKKITMETCWLWILLLRKIK